MNLSQTEHSRSINHVALRSSSDDRMADMGMLARRGRIIPVAAGASSAMLLRRRSVSKTCAARALLTFIYRAHIYRARKTAPADGHLRSSAKDQVGHAAASRCLEDSSRMGMEMKEWHARGLERNAGVTDD